MAQQAADQTPAPKPSTRSGAAKSKGQPAKPSNQAASPKLTPGPANQKWPLVKLNVEGNRTFAPDQIIKLAGLSIGDPAGKDEFEAARERLIATGAFSSVGYKYEPEGAKGYSGTLIVTEFDQVYPFRFDSIPLDAKEMTAHLRASEPLFSDRLPATKENLARMTAALTEFAQGRGFKEPIVAKLSPAAAGGLEIVFQPSLLPSVAEIDFKGNSVISTEALRQAVAGPGVGAIYTEEKFRQVLEASVRPAYEERGRLRVKFPKIDAVPARGVKGLAVTVHVDEGPEYTLKSVDLIGEIGENSTPSKPLLKEGKFDLNAPANFAKIKQGVSAMEHYLRRRGYIEVKSTTERKIDDAAKTLDLRVNIDSGPQFTMRNLTINGLDIETEPHIRKLWALKKGAPFDVDYPEYFLGRLKSDDIMENLGRTKSEATPEPALGVVDVTLTFQGEKKAKPDAKRDSQFPSRVLP